MRIVLFDIDGTLLLTGGAGLRALRAVFLDLFGVEDASVGIEFHGRTDPWIIQSMARKWLDRELDAGEFDDLRVRYLERLEHFLHEVPDFRVLPGAAELVGELARDATVSLGLATGNFEPAARAKLRRAGLHGHFAFGGFGSDSEDRDELTRLAVERGRRHAGGDVPVFVVGDSPRDVGSARAAGVPCLAVATGNASRQDLEAAGATWALESLEDPRARSILGLR